MASVQRSFFEVILTNEREDAVVKVEAIAGESRNMLRKLGVVGVKIVGRGLGLGFCLLGLGSVEGREWRFDTELAFAAATFGGGFFGRGEREEAEGYGRDWWPAKLVGFG